MIYITGDCHRDFQRFNTRSFPQQKEMTKVDYVIICGDFGGVWDAGMESAEEKYLLDWLENKNYTTLFVDGNHDNFDRLYSYPVERWHGGKVHVIRPSVLHLMRGQVFVIDGRRFFTFGGAECHDIKDGILEPDDPNLKRKIKWMRLMGKYFRVNHISWWERELPTEEEMEEGRRNLAEAGNKVDYIVTHCCSSSTQKALIGNSDVYKDNCLTRYLEEIKQNTEYKKWFFGHYHMNLAVGSKEQLLYKQIQRVIF